MAKKQWVAVKRGQAGGFTLIEVLIAATLLFMVVSTALLSYQTAMRASDGAAKTMQLLSITEVIQQHVKQAIRDNVEDGASGTLEGKTTILGVEVNWEAVPIHSAPPASRFDPSADMDVEYEPRYFQYKVTLSMHLGNVQRTYYYVELAWNRNIDYI